MIELIEMVKKYNILMTINYEGDVWKPYAYMAWYLYYSNY